ncbi:MAG: hypothetical protein ACUVXG_13855 [Anaerolineae bacterium]
MKRIVWVSLRLSLVIALGAVAVAGSPGDAEEQADIRGWSEDWAARYPKEYADWESSVHGVAYLSGNADAPGCTSCHEDPETGEIYTASYRLDIPTRCAQCHDNKELMAKYGIAADTYASYKADYHGATITYYRNTAPAMWRYEAVCSDCHSAHAIYPPGHPQSAKATLAERCRRCHLGATDSFAYASAGHLRTTRQAPTLVYLVALFYKILIPVVLGIMWLYIFLDVWHRVRARRGGKAA